MLYVSNYISNFEMVKTELFGFGMLIGVASGYDSSFDLTLAEKYVHFSGAGNQIVFMSLNQL
jgi:hypothetical protein